MKSSHRRTRFPGEGQSWCLGTAGTSCSCLRTASCGAHTSPTPLSSAVAQRGWKHHRRPQPTSALQPKGLPAIRILFSALIAESSMIYR